MASCQTGTLCMLEHRRATHYPALLFNLYIEPRIRYIKWNAAIRGITVPNTERVIESLFFADDITSLWPGLIPDDT
jgi:hypothetical protein